MNPADAHFEAPQLDPAMAAIVPGLLLGAVMLVGVVWFVVWLWNRHPFLFVCCALVVAFGAASNVVGALATAPPPHFGKVHKQPGPRLSGLFDLGGKRSPAIVKGRACPVPNAQFTSSWGAPRVGHTHQGNDLMAPAGSPVRAFAAGTVSRVSNRDVGLGGLSVWVTHPDGSASYYAHNSANDAHVGQRVVAGQLIGRVGNTGNARHTGSHVHFEWHPRGRGTPAVNPYPLLRQVCRGAR